MTSEPNDLSANNDPLGPHAWLIPQTWPELPVGAVHLWRLSLNVSEDRRDALHELLTADERHRSDRFVFVEHRQRFIACRGRLRQILAGYLERPPDSLLFRYTHRGKPYMDAAFAAHLDFNLSHAEDVALISVTRDGPVGVDLEKIRPLTADLWALADQHFTNSERTQLRALTPDRQLEAFFRGWTRKEALIKADGAGLAISLDQVEVGLAEQCSDDPVHFPPEARPPYTWRLHSIDPAQGYVAALAAPLQIQSIQFYDWASP